MPGHVLDQLVESLVDLARVSLRRGGLEEHAARLFSLLVVQMGGDLDDSEDASMSRETLNDLRLILVDRNASVGARRACAQV